MKKHFKKLPFLKFFINTRLFLILALFLLIISTFVGLESRNINNALAALLTYTENFLTTTYKDAVNTTGRWNTISGRATLLGRTWTGLEQNFDNLSNNSGYSSAPQIALDTASNPYVVWYDSTGGNYDIYFSKWTPTGCGGTGCWTNMAGTTAGYENISNTSDPSMGPLILVDPANNPYVVWTEIVGGFGGVDNTYFTKWTPTGCGGSGCWTKMDGTLGHDNLFLGRPISFLFDSNNNAYVGGGTHFTKWTPTGCGGTGCWTKMDGTAGSDAVGGGQMQIDSNNNPYFIQQTPALSIDDIYFTKWTPTGCGGTGCWTNMAGTTAGYENISNTPDQSQYPQFGLGSDNNPYVVWYEAVQNIYFTKWTPTGCGGTGCWTNMAGNLSGPEAITFTVPPSQASFPIIQIDTFNNPYIIYEWRNPRSDFDILFTRWTPTGCGGTGCWTKMDGTSGSENISNSTGSTDYPQMKLDFNNNPNVVWQDTGLVGYNIYFRKWTVGAGPIVCGIGKNDCWTKIDDTAGADNFSKDPVYLCEHPLMQLDPNDNPYIVWYTVEAGGLTDVYFIHWSSHFSPTSTIQSLNVETDNQFVLDATLNSTQVFDPLTQTIEYYLSGDGGTTWDPVTQGLLHTFVSSLGQDLRWKAVLTTTDIDTTPYIDDLTINYNTTKIFCSVVPSATGVGDTVDINSTLSFSPTSITAQVINNGHILATLPLVNIGGNNYSVPLTTDSNYSGTNNVTISADDPGPPETVTCSSSFSVGGGGYVDYRPAAPTDFTCNSTSFDIIRWSFTDNATNETGFRLYGPQGLILDTGAEVVTDINHFDETNLETNIQYLDRYVTTFNGAGESGPSNMASCYTLAKTPLAPKQVNVNDSSITVGLEPNDGNPPATEYAIKELTTNKYLDANGLFADTETWQTHDNWGGSSGIAVTGLTPGTAYQFAVKARNGDNIETAFSPALGASTTGIAPITGGTVTLTATKGVAINLASNFQNNLVKIAQAAVSAVSEPKYIALLREFSFFLNIIILILIIFFAVSLYSSVRYLASGSKNKSKSKLIWQILTQNPISVFQKHARRDENGVYRHSFQKHKELHIASQKTLMRTLGIIALKLIILLVSIIGLAGVNHNGFAQSQYVDSGTQVDVDDKLSYIVEFQNTSALSVENVSVYDTLDPHLTYVPGSARLKIGSASETSSGIAYTNGTLYFNVGSLAVQTAGQATFDAKVKAGSEGATITNQAFVSGTNFTTVATNPTSNRVFAPVTKYACNLQTGSCSLNANGPYGSLADCQSVCAAINTNINVPPPSQKYSCNTRTGSCSLNPNGPYDELADCQAACKAIPPPCVGTQCPPPPIQKYSCETMTGTCMANSDGPYASLSDCQSACSAAPLNINVTPTEQRYSCDSQKGACVANANGSYTNLTDCRNSCVIINANTPPILFQPPFLPPILGSLTSPQAKTVATNYVTPVLLAIAAVNTIPTAIILISYLLPYLELLFIEPLLWLFRRKRKKWGVVYNSLSKVPVDLAVVRLYRASDKKLLQTRVTDKQGRYIFVVKEAGRYYISVNKNGFVFPTRYLSSDKEDTKYIDLYHGEAVEVTAKDAAITANIPLDPVEKRIMPERQVIFGYLVKNLRMIISYVGLVLAILIFLIYPSWITGLSILIHILLFIVFVRLIVPKKPKSWGIVYDQKSKAPLHYAVVRIFDIKFNKLLETQVTDGKGRYSFLVGSNQYQLLAEKEGYAKKEIKPVDLINKEEIVDLDLGLAKT